METYRLVKLLPYTNRLVMRASGDELSVIADCQCPNLAMVPLELLNELKFVAIPVFEHLVFADGPEIVRRLALALTRVVSFERYLHDALIVGEDRLMAVTEVEAPYLDVFVGGAGDYEFRVMGDVHGEDWELKYCQDPFCGCMRQAYLVPIQ